MPGRPQDLLVDLAAVKAAVERLAPQLVAWLADAVDLDLVAAAVVVEPRSIPVKHC